jgi:hypothetical protein
VEFAVECTDGVHYPPLAELVAHWPAVGQDRINLPSLTFPGRLLLRDARAATTQKPRKVERRHDEIRAVVQELMKPGGSLNPEKVRGRMGRLSLQTLMHQAVLGNIGSKRPGWGKEAVWAACGEMFATAIENRKTT